ncbi:MAG: hypothetical protein LBD91_08175 [Prevotellaceae bacterium]|jgi:hypothetical protein|nr:hypothetical protein [Prevotellaceae bacterium]
MAHATLQKPDVPFMALANSIYEECHAHSGDWSIDAARLAEFCALLAIAYAANSDRATKNAITSANKKEAFMKLKRFMGLFIHYLIANTAVPDAALAAMGLRSRQRYVREPLPRPTMSPAPYALLQSGRYGENGHHGSRMAQRPLRTRPMER